MAQVFADRIEQSLALLLELPVGGRNQGVDAFAGRRRSLVEIVDIGADRYIAETAPGCAVLAGVVRNRRGRRQLPQTGKEDHERAGPAVFGQGIPAVALRREVQIAAIEADAAGPARLRRWRALKRLVAERRNVVLKVLPRLAARLPFRPQIAVDPRRRQVAGFWIVANDKVVSRMRNGTALVIPDESVVSRSRIGDRRKALGRRPHTVNKRHQVGVIESQRHIADNSAILLHWCRPAHDAAKALADRVLQPGITGFLRQELALQFRRLGSGVGTDPLRLDVRPDDLGDVDLAHFELLELRPVGFRLGKGVLAPADIAQARLQKIAVLHFHLLDPVRIDKAHLKKQRPQRAASIVLRRARVEVSGVVRQWRTDRIIGVDRAFRHPARTVGRRNVVAVFVERPNVR